MCGGFALIRSTLLQGWVGLASRLGRCAVLEPRGSSARGVGEGNEDRRSEEGKDEVRADFHRDVGMALIQGGVARAGMLA